MTTSSPLSPARSASGVLQAHEVEHYAAFISYSHALDGANALPPAFSERGLPEPLWVDFRPLRTAEPTDPAYHAAAVNIAATLHGIPKDELVGEQIRQHRKRRRSIALAATNARPSHRDIDHHRECCRRAAQYGRGGGPSRAGPARSGAFVCTDH